MTDFETPSIDFSNRDRALQQIWSYVQSFQEQVSFWLRNLDKDSFNEHGLKEITEPITAQIQDVAGNVTTLQATAEGLQSSVADADGKATTAQQTAEGLTTRVSSAEGDISSLEQTASGLSVRVSGVESRNTVTINANGMYVADQYGNTTALTGDHIKSGTLEGVTLLSINSNNSMVKIYNGGIDLGEAPYYNMGSLYYDMNIGKVYLYSVPGRPIKIESGSNLSIDASGTIYIGASSGYSGNVNIGQSGGTVNINGTVMVNGVKI